LNNKLFIVILAIHFVLSLAGFLALSGWALATADATTAPIESAPAVTSTGQSGTRYAVSGWLAGVVHFGLLQPLAHWVLQTGAIAWWTWPGLLGLLVLIGVNSTIVARLSSLGIRSLRKRRSRG
jgi:hypothetical protein